MTTRISLLAFAVLLVAGCAGTELETLDTVSDKLPFMKNGKTSKYGSPKKMAAIWSHAVYTQPGHPPTRGFGGRLYFYNEESEPVPIEGQLVVYGYDDSVKGSPAEVPERKFVFTAEQFTEHFTPSDLGASYSIWLPWDEVGGVRKSVSLLPVFTSTDGDVVMGTQTANVLKGKVPENVDTQPKGYFTPLSPTADQGVRPASFEGTDQSVASTRDQWKQTDTYVPKDAKRKRLRSTTIRVPMTMNQRLIQEPTAEGIAGGVQEGELKEKSEGARRMPPITGSNAESIEASKAWSRSGVAAATEPSSASPRAARFVRPRSPVPREPRGRPGHGRLQRPPRPAGLQSDHPFPP